MRHWKHFLFWVGIFILMFMLFKESFHSLIDSFYFISLLMPIIIATSYFFNYYLVPNYLLQKKYWRFALYCAYMIIISLYLEMLVIILTYIYLANYKFDNMGPVFSEVIFLALALYLVVLIQSFIRLVKISFQKEKVVASLAMENEKHKQKNLQIRVERKNVQVPIDELSYVESLADYVKVITVSKGVFITKEKISAIAHRLPDNFIRVHRSFVVNTSRIEASNKSIIHINGEQIPISRTYKKDVLLHLKSLSLKEA